MKPKGFFSKIRKVLEMKHSVGLIILAAMALTIHLVAGTSESLANDHADKIDELVKVYFQDGRFNGTVLVAEGGDVIYKTGWGLANMEWNIPNAPDTKFRIASMSKQFTAMLIMQLVQEGKIALDGKLTDYLPEFRRDTGDRVTIHQLLTHTSGLPDYSDAPGFWNDLMRRPLSPEFVIDSLSSGDLLFEPGTQYRYNNGGFYLLSLIVERVTGQEFAELLQERILQPVGMNDSGLDRPEVILKRRAAGYEQFVDGFENAPYRQIDNLLGTGAIYSTVEDLYRWDRALYTDRLLAPEYMEIMLTPFLEDYAYGLRVHEIPLGETGDSTIYVGHSGSVAGFNSRIVRLPEDGHCIILLCNIAGWTQLSDLYRGIINILYDLPYELPKKSIAMAMYKTIMKKDLDAAIAQYHRLKAEQPEAYDFAEDELNSLGYRLMRTGRIKESIAIFRLNAQAYPDSWNAYDSLGEALIKDGQTDLAREYHRQSLQLHPDQYRTDLAVLLEEEQRRSVKEPSEIIHRLAGIEDLGIQVTVSAPPQVHAVIKGYFSDGCTTLESIEQKRADHLFTITITTQRPAGMNCPQVIVPFQETIPLMVSGLTAGTYTVTVNDRLSGTFVLQENDLHRK
jgi:CubicO group peptidase (beta-lactamase class C family)